MENSVGKLAAYRAPNASTGKRAWRMVLLDASDKASRLGDAQRVRRYVESVASADPIERIALGRI